MDVLQTYIYPLVLAALRALEVFDAQKIIVAKGRTYAKMVSIVIYTEKPLFNSGCQ